MNSENQITNNILAQMPKVFLAGEGGVQAKPKSCLASSIGSLDDFLEGGLNFGSLTEWGAPLGRGGREVAVRYLEKQNWDGAERQPLWSLWVCGRQDVKVYPPAWMARGIRLSHVRFAETERPVVDLKPVFFEPFFKVIVLDAPRYLTSDDCAFLARQARANHQAIIIIRDYFLSEKRGNVWAKLRLNCWQEERDERFHLQVVRGLSPRRLSLTLGGI